MQAFLNTFIQQPLLLRAASVFTIFFPLGIFLGTAGADICLSMVAVLFVVHTVLRRDFAWLKEVWVQIALVFWGVMCVRGLFTLYPLEALETVSVWGRFPVFAAALGYWVLRDHEIRRYTLISLAIMVLLVAVDMLVQYHVGVDVFGYEKALKKTYQELDAHYRLTAMTGEQNIGILLAFMMMPVLVMFLAWSNQPSMLWLHRFFLLAAVALVVLAVLLSGERMAFLLTLAGLVVIAFFFPPVRRITVIAGFSAIILVVSIYVARPDVFDTQKDSVARISFVMQDFSESIYGRILASGMRKFETQPVFGAGPRHYRFECAKLARDEEEKRLLCREDDKVRFRHPHNIYIELLAENGIIGTGLFLAMIGCWVVGFWRKREILFSHPVFFGAVLAVAIRLWPIATSASFYVAWSMASMWFMLGLALAYQKEADS